MTSEKSICHFIAYVRWDIVLDWKKEEIKAGHIKKRSHVKPYAYGTAVEEVYNKIRKDDILWILTIPKFGKYSSFPSLNAKIVVEEKIDQGSEKNKEQLEKIPKYIKKKWDPHKKEGWQYVIIGNKDKSRYFPINNSYNKVVKPILGKEKIERVEQRIQEKHYGFVAQYFQKIRKIEKKAGKKIENYQKMIQKKAVLFVSYRHGRGIKIVKDIVERLLKKEINCWFDISRIPKRLSKKDFKKIEKYFEYELINAINESHGFLAIKRKDYFSSVWTTLEYKHAKKTGLARENRGKDYRFCEVELVELLQNDDRRKLVKSIIF